MKKTYLHIFLFLAVMAFFACEKKSIVKPPEDLYFDLEKFVDQMKEVEQSISSVEKIVQLNGKKEMKEIKNYDLSGELDILKKYDINKVSLAGKYDFKHRTEDTLLIEEYLANEEDLKTRKLRIWKKDGQVERIEVDAQQNSIMANSQQKINYLPKKSFALISKDDNKYSGDLVKEILITLNH